MQGASCCQGRQHSFTVARSISDNNVRLQEGSQNHPVLLRPFLTKTSWLASQRLWREQQAWWQAQHFKHWSPVFLSGHITLPWDKWNHSSQWHSGSAQPKSSCYEVPNSISEDMWHSAAVMPLSATMQVGTQIRLRKKNMLDWPSMQNPEFM